MDPIAAHNMMIPMPWPGDGWANEPDIPATPRIPKVPPITAPIAAPLTAFDCRLGISTLVMDASGIAKFRRPPGLCAYSVSALVPA